MKGRSFHIFCQWTWSMLITPCKVDFKKFKINVISIFVKNNSEVEKLHVQVKLAELCPLSSTIRWTSLITTLLLHNQSESTPTTSPCRMDDVWSGLFHLCKISHCYNLFDFLIQNFFFFFGKNLADLEEKIEKIKKIFKSCQISMHGSSRQPKYI